MNDTASNGAPSVGDLTDHRVQYSGPTTTADSKKSERLVVDARGKDKKRKALRKRVLQQSSSPEN